MATTAIKKKKSAKGKDKVGKVKDLSTHPFFYKKSGRSRDLPEEAWPSVNY